MFSSNKTQLPKGPIVFPNSMTIWIPSVQMDESVGGIFSSNHRPLSIKYEKMLPGENKHLKKGIEITSCTGGTEWSSKRKVSRD